MYTVPLAEGAVRARLFAATAPGARRIAPIASKVARGQAAEMPPRPRQNRDDREASGTAEHYKVVRTFGARFCR